MTCLGNLNPTSVRAYNNAELMAAGAIPLIGTTVREIRPVGGGSSVNLPKRQAIKVLPSDRIYAEFYYDVYKSQLQPGFDNPLAATVGAAIVDPTLLLGLDGVTGFLRTAIVFHTANTKTYVNREVTLTSNNFYKDAEGNDIIKFTAPEGNVMAVLGVTLDKINFVSPSVPLTQAQRNQAKSLTQAEINSALGREVLPELLTDDDIRIILNIDDSIDELSTIGKNNDRTGSHPQRDYQVLAEFTAYKPDYSDAEGSTADNVNLFLDIERDSRKNRFRSDNFYDKTSGQDQQSTGHSIINNNSDDLTDKIVVARVTGKMPRTIVREPGQRPTASEPGELKTLTKGATNQKVYITYIGGESISRHIIQSQYEFYLILIGPAVYALPSKLSFKSWRYKKYSFLVPPSTNNLKFNIPDYLLAKQSQKPFVFLYGQRIVSNQRAQTPFILGCYCMDITGFCQYNFRTKTKTTIWPLDRIGNQEVFLQQLDLIIERASPSYNQDKTLNTDVAEKSIFVDCVFDVSEITNSVCLDNEKYGYEKFTVNAIKSFRRISFIGDRIDPQTFYAPKLDFVNNFAANGDFPLNLPDILSFVAGDRATQTLVKSLCIQDVTFDDVESLGSASVNGCNLIATARVGANNSYDITTRGNLLLRTPIYLGQNLTINSRIHIEAMLGNLSPGAQIFVGTKLTAGSWRYSVVTDAYKNLACLTYMDLKSKTLRYRLFDDFETRYQLDAFRQHVGGEVPDFGNYKFGVNDFIGVYSAASVGADLQPAKTAWNVSSDGSRGLPDKALVTPGVNVQFGESPAYLNGKEPDIFLAVAKARGLITRKETPLKIFEKSYDRVRLIDADAGSSLPSGATSGDKYTYFTVTPYVTKERQKYTNLWKSLGGESDKPIRLRRLRIVAPGEALLIGVAAKDKIIVESADRNTLKPYSLLKKDLDEYFNSTISLVFPFDEIVIDQIPIRGHIVASPEGTNIDLVQYYNKPYPLGDFSADGQISFVVDISIDVSYAKLLPFQIRGPALLPLDMEKMKIWIEDYVTQEEYEKITIESTSVATCFDAAQYLYVFYEDRRANQGILKKRISNTEDISYDGKFNSISTDAANTLSQYAFFNIEDVFTEISCLVSPDLGDTWYDFKAIVRTMAREQIGNPMVFADHNANLLHLFYNLEGNLMHKLIDPYDFDARDTFKGYIRPIAYQTINTPVYHGLYHFSEKGIQMRSNYSSVVIDNDVSDFMARQLKITNDLITVRRSDYRISQSSAANESSRSASTKTVDDGKELLDSFVYKDNEGNLNLVYAYNGKIFVRRSSDNGMSWYDLVQQGVSIHKNVQSQEYITITNIGCAYDDSSNLLYITYFADNMLFYRKLASTFRSTTDVNKIIWSVSQDLTVASNRPCFVTGSINQSTLANIAANKQYFIFPYAEGEEDKFAESSRLDSGSFPSADSNKHIYNARELSCKGYALSNGVMRFFYIDEWDNIQGFSVFDLPVLDVQGSQFFANKSNVRNKYIENMEKLYTIKA